ncbi:NADP-dependent glyceraldehyde-3-phosphate dehydrogenase, partial [bacterium]|nr:NADP-dependent glyceraldehyde-3-phosphate dehydrogenase [bacterium]
MKQKIEKIFPKKTDVLANVTPPLPMDQTEYLINGELLRWKGPFEKVHSPVFLENNDSFDNLIGLYPLLDEASALKALKAATEAYDNGQGEWPLMTIAKRIVCFKKFIHLMKDQR